MVDNTSDTIIRKLTWRDSITIRILLIVAKYITTNDDLKSAIDALDTKIRVEYAQSE